MDQCLKQLKWIMSANSNVHANISHLTHFLDDEEPFFVVTLNLYFFGSKQGPFEVKVDVSDEGQSSEKVYREACDKLAEELEKLREFLSYDPSLPHPQVSDQKSK